MHRKNMAHLRGWPIVRNAEVGQGVGSARASRAASWVLVNALPSTRVHTSTESNERDMRGGPRRVRQRGRYWLLFACLPMLWGLAATGPAGEARLAAGVGVASAGAGRAELAQPPAVVAPPALPAARVEGERAPAPPAPASPAAVEDAAARRDVAPACEPTPLTPQALALALRVGHERRFGVSPHADRWACAWAHCAFEQSRGEAVYGNNLGHVTARSGDGRVCLRRLRERVARDPDRWELVNVWFRVFDTPADGAAAYWDLLAASYNSVLARCDEADARGAARRLAAIGYFTGPEEPYVDGMARLFVNARGVLIPGLMAADAAR